MAKWCRNTFGGKYDQFYYLISEKAVATVKCINSKWILVEGVKNYSAKGVEYPTKEAAMLAAEVLYG